MHALPSRRPSIGAALAAALLSCGGGSAVAGLQSAIVVPNAGSDHVSPGGALSFVATCTGTGDTVTHVWSFPGGSPASSTAELPGPVTFASAGTYQVSHACADSAGHTSNEATHSVVVETPGASAFAIELQFLNGAEAYQSEFQAAADRVVEVVRGPVPGLDREEAAWSACGDVPISTSVGHFLVLASVEAIDGSLGTVASSGPCYVRTSDGLPYVGIVRLDVADVATLQAWGTLQPVILHELLHVLGFGSLWGSASDGGFGLLTGAGEDDPFFDGGQARAAFRDFNEGSRYAGTPVPVENSGGGGTRDRHWRAAVFGTELMTPSIQRGSTPALSRTTLETLADMGYRVDVDAADAYGISSQSTSALRKDGQPAEEIDLGEDVLPVVPRIR